MAVVNPPIFLQAGSHPAANLRQIHAAMFGAPLTAFAGGIQAVSAGGAHGVAGPGDLAVTPSALNMTVAAGVCIVRGTEALLQGAYGVVNDAPLIVTLDAHDAQARKDLIVVRIRDAAYSGSVNTAEIVAVKGTAAISPVDPVVPANSLVLARCDVPAGSGAVTVTDVRTFATTLGGIHRCRSTTRPSPAWPGLTVFETDTLRTLQCVDASGPTWVQVGAAGAHQTWTPTISSTGAAPNIGTGATQTGRYERVGRRITGHGIIILGTSPSAGSGTLYVNLPIQPVAPTAGVVPVGRVVFVNTAGNYNHADLYYNGNSLSSVAVFEGSSAFVGVTGILQSGTWAAGNSLRWTFNYEAAS